MDRRSLILAALIVGITAAMALWAYSVRHESVLPFLMVQGCLNDQSGTIKFLEELRSIAAEEGMRFIDGSAQAARAYERGDQTLVDYGIAAPMENREGPRVFVELLRNNMAVMATDLRSGYEVALGFNGSGGTVVDVAFAQRVIDRLEKNWEFEEVPEGLGAIAKGNCM